MHGIPGGSGCFAPSAATNPGRNCNRRRSLISPIRRGLPRHYVPQLLRQPAAWPGRPSHELLRPGPELLDDMAVGPPRNSRRYSAPISLVDMNSPRQHVHKCSSNPAPGWKTRHRIVLRPAPELSEDKSVNSPSKHSRWNSTSITIPAMNDPR